VLLTFRHINRYLRNVRRTFAQTLNNMYKARGQFNYGRINAIDLELGDRIGITADGPTWIVMRLSNDNDTAGTIVVTLARMVSNKCVTVSLVYGETQQLHAR